MKKLILITFIFLISCSGNDEPSIDPIIGKWKLHKLLAGGIDILNDCNRQNTLEFFENGEEITEYHRYDNTGECIKYTDLGSWGESDEGDGWYCHGVCKKYVFSNNNNIMINPGNPGHENPEDWDRIYIRIK